jgi:hypothetical protein
MMPAKTWVEIFMFFSPFGYQVLDAEGGKVHFAPGIVQPAWARRLDSSKNPSARTALRGSENR